MPRPAPGLFFDEDRARRSQVGEARGGVDDVADDRDAGRLECRADHHLAGVHARMHLGDRESRTALVQLTDAIAHGQSGPHGALGVVLVRGGDTEDRHEAVALDLWHGAPVVLDDALELGHRRPDEGEDLLRIQRGRESRVPGQV